jgi:hypothetical protein
MALVPAVLAELGYTVVGVDDFEDPWHDPTVVAALEEYAAQCSFRLKRSRIEDFVELGLNGVSLVDVIEHLHNGPRPLLNHVGNLLTEGALLVVVMPNSVNLRKRLAVMRGKTNYPSLDQVFGSQPPWRGHVREYTPQETRWLLEKAGFDVVCSGTFHAIVYDRRLRTVVQSGYRMLTRAWPSLRDSVYAVGRKPSGWRPVDAAQSALDEGGGY